MPSGHTSAAFQGDAFIHKRYGFDYAIVPYMGAIFTGYSRVHANKNTILSMSLQEQPLELRVAGI